MAKRVKKSKAGGQSLGTLRNNDGEQVEAPKKRRGKSDPRRDDARRWWRFQARHQSHAWIESGGLKSRLTICGTPDIYYGFVPVTASDGVLSARYGHILRCGSVFGCPVCGSKIRKQRNDELREAFTQWLGMGEGHMVAFLTVTMSHSVEESCEAVLRRLSHTPNKKRGETEKRDAGAWRRFTKTAEYRGSKRDEVTGFIEAGAVFGSVAVLECTYGVNGWHWHKHIGYLCSRMWTAPECEEIEKRLKAAWIRSAENAGGRASEAHGLTLDICADPEALGDYLTKPPAEALADELARGDMKDGGAGLDPWDLLDPSNQPEKWDRLGLSVARARLLWLDYVQATKGKHFMDWSPKLRERLGLGEEETDQEIAEATEEEKAREVAFMAPYLFASRMGKTEMAREVSHAFADGDVRRAAALLGADVGEWGGLPSLYRDGIDRGYQTLTETMTPKEAEAWGRRERLRLSEDKRKTG